MLATSHTGMPCGVRHEQDEIALGERNKKNGADGTHNMGIGV